ncbi:MAG TPA: sugar phosphate isomerase/epimerase [Phycisphaerae bacterium]|nr:sugar phosphate isomerase/epimerase [Phycisphaerae bacterium]
MKPSVWTSYLYGLTLEEMVEAFAGKGWRYAELSTEHSEMLLSRGKPGETGRAFRKFAGDRGMSFPQGHLEIGVDVAAVDRAGVINRLKRWLDLYLALGVKAAVIHPGGFELEKSGMPPEKVHEARVEAFGELARHVAGSDLFICMENVCWRNDLEGISRIIDACGTPNLGICLDTGHLHLVAGRQGDFIRGAGARLKALHIADNDGTSDQHLIPFARGTIKWDEVIAALREVQYDGLFNFEIPGETLGCPMPVRMAKLEYLRALADIMLGDGRA